MSIAITDIYNAVIAAFKPGPEHANLSPSSSSRWLRCTASVGHNVGQDDPSEYADEGTAAHTLSSTALLDNRNCAEYIGQTIPVLSEDGTIRREFTVDDEMATYAQVYVDTVRDKIHDGCQVFIEKRVQTGIVSEQWGEIGGTGDAIILDLTHALIDVNDLKYGKGIQVYAAKPVPAPEYANGPCVLHDGIYWELNSQLAIYALGALLEYGWMSRFRTVRLSIHQPRLDHYSIAEIPVEDLIAWGEGHVRAIVKEIDTAPQYRPDEDTCRWCAIKAQCQALNEHVEKTVFDDFADVSGTIDNTAVAAALERLELVKQWCSAVEAKSNELAGKGALPGWKLVETRKGNRMWDDAEEVERLFKETYRMPDDEAYKPRTLISPTDAEKKLKKAHPTRWERLQEHIKRGNPSTGLVRESDPRPAVTTADDFQVVS